MLKGLHDENAVATKKGSPGKAKMLKGLNDRDPVGQNA